MANVCIDIDLGDVDTYELCSELIQRLKGYNRDKLGEVQKQQIREELTELSIKIGLAIDIGNNITMTSLDDRMKIELLSSVWSKFSYWELEEKLK